MGRRDKLIIPVRCAALLASLALPLAAAERQLEVDLDYRADPACPTRERFLAEVAERDLTLTPNRTAAVPLVAVELTELGGQARGRLTVKSERSGDTERSVDAPTCDEATRALALITALALMPEATEVVPEHESEPEPSEPAPDRGQEATLVVDPRPRPLVFYQSLRTLLEGSFGTAPESALAASGGFGLGWDKGSLYSPFLRIGARGTFARLTTPSGGSASARFQQTVGVLDLCPLGLLDNRFGVRLCVPTELGALSASGSGTDENASVTRFYGATGLGLEASLRLFGALTLEVAGAMMVPYEQSDFVLAGATVFSTPPVGGRVGAGLGWSFGRD